MSHSLFPKTVSLAIQAIIDLKTEAPQEPGGNHGHQLVALDVIEKPSGVNEKEKKEDPDASSLFKKSAPLAINSIIDLTTDPPQELRSNPAYQVAVMDTSVRSKRVEEEEEAEDSDSSGLFVSDKPTRKAHGHKSMMSAKGMSTATSSGYRGKMSTDEMAAQAMGIYNNGGSKYQKHGTSTESKDRSAMMTFSNEIPSNIRSATYNSTYDSAYNYPFGSMNSTQTHYRVEAGPHGLYKRRVARPGPYNTPGYGTMGSTSSNRIAPSGDAKLSSGAGSYNASGNKIMGKKPGDQMFGIKAPSASPRKRKVAQYSSGETTDEDEQPAAKKTRANRDLLQDGQILKKAKK